MRENIILLKFFYENTEKRVCASCLKFNFNVLLKLNFKLL